MNIYIPRNASTVEKTAADELSLWLGKAYGTEFPVCAEDGGSPGVFVGHTGFAAARGISAEGGRNELNGAEAWRICTADGSLVVTGGRKNTDRGVIYAAEHYLEDVVGVRFWNAVEEYVPSLSGFSIDPSLDLSGEPEMVMRSATACSFVGNDPAYMARRRMNYSNLPKEWGGNVMYSRRGHCHTTDTILPPEKRFDEHPDWFAWNESLQKRLPYGQYCLNNEEFLQVFEEAFIEDIGRIYAECDEQGEPRPHHFHISLTDNEFSCECPLCKARIAQSGYTGNVLRFVNRTAEAAEKVYPGVLVETLAYWAYMDPPPDDTVPAKNVIIRIANVDIDILHSLTHPNNAHGLEVLKAWSDICRKNGTPLYIWDYNILYTHTPTPNVFRLSDLMRTYQKYGVQAVYIENEAPLLTDFWTLKHWLLMNLIEKPDADAPALIRDFMNLYYGPAAPMLTEWQNRTEAASAQSPLYMYCVYNYSKFDHIPYELYAEGCRLFDEAEKAAMGDPVFLRRVRQERANLDMAICLRYDSLLYQAGKRGKAFPVNRADAARRFAEIAEETRLQLQPYIDTHPDVIFSDTLAGPTMPHWEGSRCLEQWREPHISAPLPECLAGTEALQVSLSDYCAIASDAVGTVIRRDPDSLSGWATCLPLDAVPAFVHDQLHVYPQGDQRRPFTMTLTHRSQTAPRFLALEDLKPDEYALYPLFDIDDLSVDSNTTLRIVPSAFTFHISGLALIFPGKKLSLLMRAKFSGAAYGGSASEPDMISFDRIYVVPKE